MDRIIISGLEICTIIGTLPHERISKQRVILEVSIYGDFRKAAQSDHWHDTFDYSEIEQTIVRCVAESSFQLLEALSEHVANAVLAFDKVERVKVNIAKPGAPKYARGISIEIERP